MKRKQIFLWTAAILIYLGLYGTRLSFPPVPYFDEVYEVKTARLLIGPGGYDSIHPPLGHMIRAISIRVLGDQPWVWRFPSLLAGLGCLIVLYALTKKLTSSSLAAFFAAFLFGLDGLPFTMARIGTLNSMMLFLMLLSLLCFIQYALTKEWSRRKAFLLSGLFLGLAVATRWVACGLIFIYGILYIKILKEEKNKIPLLVDTFLFMVVLPIVVYFGVFALMTSFFSLDGLGFDWDWIWDFQLSQINYNVNLKEGHGYSSNWWTWPLMLRPVWYFFIRKADFILSGYSRIEGILCIGNPFIFWLIPCGIGYLVWNFFKKASWVAGFVLAGFFTQWLPWAFVSRVKFFHYFYTVLPFVVIALAIGLEKLWSKGKWGRVTVIAYLILVVGMFAYWYPLLSGLPISNAAFKQHLWFKSWI